MLYDYNSLHLGVFLDSLYNMIYSKPDQILSDIF